MAMIGKYFAGKIGTGMKTLGSGLAKGSLSNAKVLRGMGLISLGMFGTTAMFRAIGRNRETLNRKTASPREKYNKYI